MIFENSFAFWYEFGVSLVVLLSKLEICNESLAALHILNGLNHELSNKDDKQNGSTNLLWKSIPNLMSWYHF